MVIDYQRVKTLVKKNFFEKFFWTNYTIQSFLWKILFILILMFFLKFLQILSLLLNLHLNLLDFFNLVWMYLFKNLWHHQNNIGSFASTGLKAYLVSGGVHALFRSIRWILIDFCHQRRRVREKKITNVRIGNPYGHTDWQSVWTYKFLFFILFIKL